MTEKEKGLIAAVCDCFISQFSMNFDYFLQQAKKIDKDRGIVRSDDYYNGLLASFSSSAATVEKICEMIDERFCPGLYEYMENNILWLSMQVEQILSGAFDNSGDGGKDD